MLTLSKACLSAVALSERAGASALYLWTCDLLLSGVDEPVCTEKWEMLGPLLGLLLLSMPCTESAAAALLEGSLPSILMLPLSPAEFLASGPALEELLLAGGSLAKVIGAWLRLALLSCPAGLGFVGLLFRDALSSVLQGFFSSMLQAPSFLSGRWPPKDCLPRAPSSALPPAIMLAGSLFSGLSC